MLTRKGLSFGLFCEPSNIVVSEKQVAKVQHRSALLSDVDGVTGLQEAVRFLARKHFCQFGAGLVWRVAPADAGQEGGEEGHGAAPQRRARRVRCASW
jgi:hypothetical protein